MLLMMLLTTTTAWAGEYTVTYRANISHTGNSYSAILERNDDNSKKATIVTSGSGWSGGTGVRVDDEYDVTFTPSNNLSIATNPGTHTATGFIMSSGDFTASVASNSSYYIKQVRLLDNGVQKATSATAPNSHSAKVSGSSIQFNYIEVTLTDDYYGKITPQNSLTVGTAASLTYNNTSYYKSGTTITMNAPANHIIEAASGVSGASIANDHRSYTFTMPKQNVSPGATTTEVYHVAYNGENAATCSDIVNPVFTGVTVSSTAVNVSTGYVDVIGTFSPEVIYEDGTEKHNLYLGADNKLYYPTAENFKVNACRGYFQLKGLTAGEPDTSNGVRAFVLNFGDEETTGIVDIEHGTLNIEHSADAGWYDLSGRKLYGKPTKKGLYIHQGKKIAIK